MIIEIDKINRQRRQGISKKTGKEYDFESMGILPKESTLMDINGDEFERGDRWVNGSSIGGVTDDWGEGDKVKVQIIQKEVTARDGSKKWVINFALPKGTEAMVEKAGAPIVAVDDVDPEDF